MTELVCVAPDGSLEVWYLYDQNTSLWMVEFQKSKCTEITMVIVGPEFWEREVLGEL